MTTADKLACADPATVLEIQWSLRPGLHTESQVLLPMGTMGITTEAREAVPQGYGSAILETILKVPVLFTGHSCRSHSSLLRADPQTHQPQLGVSALAYQGQT